MDYHRRELQQVSFLSRPNYVCRDKHTSVATNIFLSLQKTCSVATKIIQVAAPANDTQVPPRLSIAGGLGGLGGSADSYYYYREIVEHETHAAD